LSDQLRELQLCRQRLADVSARFRKEHTDNLPPPDRLLLPRGVVSVDAAVAALQASVTSDDLRAFDRRLQTRIEQEFTALFNVCLSSVSMIGDFQQTLEDQAKLFLSARVGEAGLGQMFAARFRDQAASEQALQWVYEQAAPPLKLFGPERTETVILGGPDGDEGERFRQLAETALPVKPADCVPSEDEVLIYREYAHVPLNALPQLGPLAEDAYTAALDGQGASPHSRCDVAAWQDVEVG
jgi:hypothetical protein